MTIVSVKLAFGLRNKRKKLRLDKIYGGFEAWFPARLKPIREALRGPEAKGVDIVIFWLHENLDEVPHKNEWWRRINTFEYDFAYDLDSLLEGDHISNLRRLMQRCSKISSRAPWPQVVAIEQALAAPFSREEKEELTVMLNWRKRKPIVLERLYGL
jgi:hypothetical protein